jgi:hypothetical protein
MDYNKLNRAQSILRVASIMEKTAAGESGVARVFSGLVKGVKDTGAAGVAGVGAASKHLREAGHPFLATAATAAPVVGGIYGAKKLADRYKRWQMMRAARLQGYA